MRETKIWILLGVVTYGAGYMYYTSKSKKENALQPDDNSSRLLVDARRQYDIGDKKAALGLYRAAAQSLDEAGLGLHHMSYQVTMLLYILLRIVCINIVLINISSIYIPMYPYQVHVGIAKVCNELGDKKGEFNSVNQALEINSRLIQKWQKATDNRTLTTEGDSPLIGLVTLKLERAILLDFIAQKKHDDGDMKGALKVYRQALSNLTLTDQSEVKGIDNMSSISMPSLTKDAATSNNAEPLYILPATMLEESRRKLYVNTLCGVLNNIGVLYYEDGMLQDAYGMLVGAVALAHASKGDVDIDTLQKSDSLLLEIKEKLNK